MNTILNSNGRLIGYNTDGNGAMTALQENGVSTDEAKMVLLGAGGAAKAIAYQSVQDVKELVILNRTPDKTKKLAEMLQKKFDTKVNGGTLSSEVLKQELETADILINSTSVGMHLNANCSPVPEDLLRSDL